MQVTIRFNVFFINLKTLLNLVRGDSLPVSFLDIDILAFLYYFNKANFNNYCIFFAFSVKSQYLCHFLHS